MPSRPEDWEFDRWDDRDSGVVVLRFGIMLEPRHDVTSSITVLTLPAISGMLHRLKLQWM